MDTDLRALFQLPPEQAIRYLEAKGYRLTWSWWEMQRAAHAKAFTVAKVARLDILQDIRAAVETALKEGRTEQWFRKELEDTLRKKGWWGRQLDADGNPYQAGSKRRLQTIYHTNLQTAYMAGRQKQFDAEADRAPFVQYLAVRDAKTRPGHAALHGKVFRLDDPAWQIVAPSNGWNCRCRARNLSQRELDARGLKVETDTQIHEREPPGKRPIDPRTGETPAEWRQRGVSIPDPLNPGERTYLWPDTGWDYNPGRSAGRHLTPQPVDELPPSTWTKGARCPGDADFAEGGCPGPAPSPRPFDRARLLPTGQTDDWYARQFLAPFGADLERPAIFTDVTGEPLRVSAELFLNRAKSAKAGQPVYKIQKRGREIYLPLLAETLRDPQEIWERVEFIEALKKTVLRRRYLAWWTIDGHDAPGLAVFEWATWWWGGVTMFSPDAVVGMDIDEYINAQRQGILRWKR